MPKGIRKSQTFVFICKSTREKVGVYISSGVNLLKGIWPTYDETMYMMYIKFQMLVFFHELTQVASQSVSYCGRTAKRCGLILLHENAVPSLLYI